MQVDSQRPMPRRWYRTARGRAAIGGAIAVVVIAAVLPGAFVIVLFPILYSTYAALAFARAGAVRLWRDGLGAALLVWLLSWVRGDIRFGPGWGMTTISLAYAFVAVTAVVQLLASRRIPTWVRVAVAIPVGTFVVLAGSWFA